MTLADRLREMKPDKQPATARWALPDAATAATLRMTEEQRQALKAHAQSKGLNVTRKAAR